jgi:hypothetical protein
MQTTDDAAAVEIGKVILIKNAQCSGAGQDNAAQTSRSVRQECDAAKDDQVIGLEE